MTGATNKLTQAVILAGGRGERLKPFTDSHPKPLFPIQGKPFILYLLEQLKEFGLEEAVLLLGYKADQITGLLGDGSSLGLKLRYDITPPEYDTADRLSHAREMLAPDFLMMYCDNYCPIDFPRLEADYFRNRAAVQLSVYTNKDGYTKNNLRFFPDSEQLEIYDKSRKTPELAGVDIGYAIVSRSVIEALPEMPGSFALAALEPLSHEGRLFGTPLDHRYYSIGSFDRMELTRSFFLHKKAVFLDRDGTLNVRPPRAQYVRTPEEFVWLEGAIEAVSLLKEKGFLLYLISNQPGIARGEMSLDDLKRVNGKMERDLAAAGVRLDGIYFCPHGWDEGCECRKPRPGMLFQAAREHSLDLPHDCVLFGDDERDIQAADAARVPGVLVSEDYPLIRAVKDYLKEEKL